MIAPADSRASLAWALRSLPIHICEDTAGQAAIEAMLRVHAERKPVNATSYEVGKWLGTTPRRWAGEAASEYLGEVQKYCADNGVECSLTSATSDIPYEAIIQAAETAGKRFTIFVFAALGLVLLAGSFTAPASAASPVMRRRSSRGSCRSTCRNRSRACPDASSRAATRACCTTTP